MDEESPESCEGELGATRGGEVGFIDEEGDEEGIEGEEGEEDDDERGAENNRREAGEM